MKIYEIDALIESCIDAETGEIIDEKMLTALNMERDKKISNVACWIKNLKAEAEALKTEKQNLEKRQKSCENKVESLKRWLAFALAGEKYKDSRVSISYRKSESVAFSDNFNIANLPEEFQKVTIEPKKSEIKDYLKSGATIDGCYIEESNNIQIR